MDLYAKLSNADLDLLHSYLAHYSDGVPLIRDHMDYFLRFWNREKAPLFQMFGEQFILKKQVRFERSRCEMQDELYNYMQTYQVNFLENPSNKFAYEWSEYIAALPYEHRRLRDYLYDLLYNYDNLVDNCYSGDSFTIPEELTVDKKEVQVPHGCKVVKIIGKVAKALGIDANYEGFRQAHSQVLNQKVLTGTLCLSIHPLDYLTMSDNECGWSSCMSWVDEYGDYRLGTIEMMNSPCVVVAYVEASDPMLICNGEQWNNKKWRQLYIVDRDIILGNRQYPYESPDLQGAAIKWLRSLASQTPSFGPYAEEVCMIENRCNNTIGERVIHFDFDTNYMYNDVYDQRMAYFNPTYKDSVFHLNFSGAAVCTGCGEVIELETVESYQVRCNECEGIWHCDCCGDSRTDEVIWVGSSRYCHWCYEHELIDCAECWEKTNCKENLSIVLGTNELLKDNDIPEIYKQFNWRYSATICNNCYHKQELEEFGPLTRLRSRHGYLTMTADLTNITDEGLDAIDNLSFFVKNKLKQIRDAETLEEREKFIKALLY